MTNRKHIKPILFSTPMVQAILKMLKKQTRREVVSSSPEMTALMMNILAGVNVEANKAELLRKAPIQSGDILWVRETWKVGAWNHEENEIAFDYKASPELKNTPWVYFDDCEKFNTITEKAINELDVLGFEPIVDEENETFSYKWDAGNSPFKWKPSIFMPKEATRIFLKVTDVRVEELQEITEADAIAEGIETGLCDDNITNKTLLLTKDYLKKQMLWLSPTLSFKTLWQSINGAESWERNPLVWVYTFEQIDKPEDF